MDLLPLEESLSPRLKWMTKYFLIALPPTESFTSWTVHSEDDEQFTEDHPVGIGPDEESALIDFAMKNNIPLWK